LSHFVYLLILAACVLGTLPLELALGVHVYAQWRRLAMTLLPVVLVFSAWDVHAIDRGLWQYDTHYLTGVRLPGRLPLEELLFFVVIPLCAVLTWEAVLVRKPQWDRSQV
jgi:lycopene cyclase domain-containing protein